jgi:hypothetical protein
MSDQFPVEKFDDWTDNEPVSIFNDHKYPFTGDEAVLDLEIMEGSKPGHPKRYNVSL